MTLIQLNAILTWEIVVILKLTEASAKTVFATLLYLIKTVSLQITCQKWNISCLKFSCTAISQIWLRLISFAFSECDFLPNCPRQWELGNGKCEEDKNVKECFFDLGDCCLDDSTICIKSSIYCIEAEFGDGICQDHNNSPFCDFDGGDCCLGDLSQCCECNCSNPIPGGHPVVG